MVWEELERALGQRLPEYVRQEQLLQEKVDTYLEASDGRDREDEWSMLEERAGCLLRVAEYATAVAQEGGRANILGGEQVEQAAASREREREREGPEPASFVSPKTMAMLQATSEFFAVLACQYPEVVKFRDEVLEGRLLTEDEADKFLASHAARFFTLEQFSDWGIPLIGHASELVEYDDGCDKDEIDHRATVWVDPPGVTKTVRYAYTREGDQEETRCVLVRTNKVIVPPNERVALAGIVPIIERRGDYTYPPFLWPGAVVDTLYNLAEELAQQFDWPEIDITRAHVATRFILTGKAPEVRTIDARWVPKMGRRLKPQWRIQLTIPPWLTEKEVLQAYRQVRGQVLGGRELPKTTTPLKVARFVWEQERSNGYKRPPWPVLLKQWNEEHPGARFKTYNHFRMYFTRGAKVVKEANFIRLRSDKKGPPGEASDALYKALSDKPRLRKMSAEEVARQLVLGGYLDEQPSLRLVEDALRSIDREERILDTDEGTEEWIQTLRFR